MTPAEASDVTEYGTSAVWAAGQQNYAHAAIAAGLLALFLKDVRAGAGENHGA